MDLTRRSARQRDAGFKNGSNQGGVRFRHLGAEPAGRTGEGGGGGEWGGAKGGDKRPQSASVSFKGVDRGQEVYKEDKER